MYKVYSFYRCCYRYFLKCEQIHTHTHTHTHIYIYIYIYIRGGFNKCPDFFGTGI